MKQSYDNIPAELKALPQWVCRKGKMPYTPTTGTMAKAGQPETWVPFEQAASARGYDGIGFEFATGGTYIGIDLDTVRDPKRGYIAPEALEIINDLDSYTEISPSGYGFHILCRMEHPAAVEILRHKAPLLPWQKEKSQHLQALTKVSLLALHCYCTSFSSPPKIWI